MKIRLTFLILAALHLSLASCNTARKSRTAERGGNGVVNLLAAVEPVTEDEIQSLKAIANSPSAMLPSAIGDPHTIPLVSESKPFNPSSEHAEKADRRAEWKRPGLNTEEVNPGDIFSENEGSVLHKALSLADELPSSERRTLLNSFTSITTSRVPMKISRRELGELQSLAPAGKPLPSRTVAFDFRSENRTVAPERLETLFDQLSKGESTEVIENKELKNRLKNQLASVRKRLQSGERLYIVTAITESEGASANYPGASVDDSDAALIANALTARFPHLDSIKAKRQDNLISITGNPRILWEFKTSEIVLQDDQLMIDSHAMAQL